MLTPDDKNVNNNADESSFSENLGVTKNSLIKRCDKNPRTQISLHSLTR